VIQFGVELGALLSTWSLKRPGRLPFRIPALFGALKPALGVQLLIF